jgi:hypothetical protein
MRSFVRYLLLLALTLAALTVYLPRRYDAPYPRQPGPAFDNAVRVRHTLAIEGTRAQVVLVGDSVLAHGIDPEALSASLGEPAYAVAVPGSTSAIWYLILKNIVLEAGDKPAYFIIVFRDTILTLPDYHVNGGYVAEIDQWATAREDFLLEHAYLNFMNPIEKWALAYFPLYSSRQQMTTTIEYYARNRIPSLFLACKRDCLDRVLASVYHVDNVEAQFREDALVADEDILFTRQAMNFDSQIGQSFLPEIIRLARENGVQLILVHERTLLFPSAQAEPKALREYKQKLSAYLDANDVTLLDFSYDPRLPESYFEDPLHMNETGKAAFTQLLADALKVVIGAGQ